MAINKCEIDAIRSRASSGSATSQDCSDLLSVLDDSYNTEAVTSKIEQIVERAIEGCISQSRIVSAVERGLAALRK